MFHDERQPDSAAVLAIVTFGHILIRCKITSSNQGGRLCGRLQSEETLRNQIRN